ncbi:MAG TPA: RcpC/CpaB family pilus assembly protein [Acidimicrobiia bacterium]|nr:RcpC/CpaB family pilus assembly protein [Acidimicrobiia bacterium]
MGTQPRVDAGNEPFAMPMRRWWTRLSSAHILIFSAATLAFLANLAVLRPEALPPRIAVAAADILPGSSFDPAQHVTFVPLATEPEVLGRLVSEEVVHSLAGRLVARRVQEGSILDLDMLLPMSSADGRRIMSLPIDRQRAAGGAISAGDRVDVIAVDRGVARYVVAGVEVVGVPEARAGTFSGSTDYHVVLAVDATAALELSAAMGAGTIHVIRANGSAAPPDLEVQVADGE